MQEEQINKNIENEVKVKDIDPEPKKDNPTMENLQNKPQIPPQVEKDDNEVSKAIVNGVSLMTLFHLTDPESNVKEEDVFKIKLSGTKFLEYITVIKDGKAFAPSDKIDPFKDHFNPSNFMKFGFNDQINSFCQSYCRPSVFNFTVVGRWAIWQQDNVAIQNRDVQIGADVPSAYTNATLNEYNRGILQYTTYVNALNVPENDQVAAIQGIYHGGPSLSQAAGGWNLWFKPCLLQKSEQSYIAGQYGELFSMLNTETTEKKNLLQRMGYTQLKDSSRKHEELIRYLYNCGSQSTLDYSPLLEQLKLLLYCDAACTLWDHVPNFNSGHFQQLVTADDPAVRAIGNINRERIGHDNIYVCYCDLYQYVQYQERNLNYPDEFQGNIKFVPVKWEWFDGRHDELLTYICSLAPYPIVGTCGEALSLNLGVNLDQHRLEIVPTPVMVEHNSSKVFIQDTNKICLVIVDLPYDPEENDRYLDPDNADYDDFYFDFGGGFVMPNLEYGAGDGNDIPNARERLRDHLVGKMQGNWRNSLDLIKDYRSLIGWEFDESLLAFIALITTNTQKVVANQRGSDVCYNQQVAGFLPMLPARMRVFHGQIPEPDFNQRCYALIGMVKQKNSTFIQDITWMQFSRLMYANRMLVGDAKSKFCEVNYVPAVVPTRDEVGYISNQREKAFYAFINNYFHISKDLLSKDYGPQLKYVAPDAVCPQTWTQQGIDNMQVSEYADVEDWVDLMSKEVAFNKSYTVILNDKYAREHNIIPAAAGQQEQLVVFKAGGGVTDMVHEYELLKQMFDRTALVHGWGANQVIANIRYIAARRQYSANNTRYNFWEPVWVISPLTAKVRTGQVQATCFATGLRTTWQNVTSGTIHSYIRVMDYAVPTFHWVNGDLFTLSFNKSILETVQSMMVRLAYNKSNIAPYSNYDTLPVFPDIVVP